MYRFFYHYNKNQTTEEKVRWSLHYKGVCHIVDDIKCNVLTETKSNGRQPRGIVRGFCSNIEIKDDVATIF
jgi:hypothetical protein